MSGVDSTVGSDGSPQAVVADGEGVFAASGRGLGRRRWPLKAYFGLLVGVVVVVAAAAAVYVHVQADRDARRQGEADSRQAAQVAATQLGAQVALLHATVASLAANPQIRALLDHPAGCTLTFSGLAGGVDQSHLDLLRPDGTVVCSSRGRPKTGRLSGYGGAGWLKKADLGALFLAPVTDGATGAQVVLDAKAVPGHGFVAAFGDLTALGPQLVSLYGNGGPVVFLVVGRDGKVIARSLEARRWIGKSVAGTAFARSGKGAERRDLDGTVRFYGQASVPGVGWRFFAGEDKSAVLAASGQLQRRQLEIILGGLAAVLLAALFAYRRVGEPLRALSGAVGARRGDAGLATVPERGPAEVATLGEEINGLISSVNRELQQRQKAEVGVRELAAIVGSSDDAIIGKTLEGVITSWNSGAERIYGYTAEQAVGRSIAFLVPPDRSDEVPAILGRLRQGQPTEHFETRRVRKDGGVIDVWLTISPIRDETGAVVGASTIARDITARRRSEAALRESEARSRAMLDAALDAIITIDETGAIVEFNAAAQAMFGRSHGEVLGEQMAELIIPPSLRERHYRGLERLLATGEGSILGERLELSALRADGSEFPVELTITRAAFDGSTLFTGYVRDISERKEAEQAVRQLAAIVEYSHDAIVGHTLDGVVTSWNTGAERLFSYSAAEMIGRSVAALGPNGEEEVVAISNAVRAGERVEFEAVRLRKDGEAIQVSSSVSPIRDGSGSIVGASAISRDIGERKQAETQLRRSEARYRDLFENASDLIATVDLDSRLTAVNTAFAEALGYTRDELLGKPLLELVPAESHERLEHAYRDKLACKRDASVYEHEFLTKDGRRIQVEVASRLVDEDGEPVGIEAICRDISERTRLEGQLRQAQKMEAIGNLAGGVAHDFNNIMMVIRTGSSLLLRQLGDEQLRADVQQIDKAAERAVGLTHQLLAFSRQQVLQPEVTDLNAIVEETLGLLERLIGENIEVDCELAPELEPILIDRGQLVQVILNLAVNARDAMPTGGVLTIETANIELDERYASEHHGVTPGKYALVKVTDSGVGMDEETRERLFEPFYTTKKEGTGLGLATVFGIVKQSGGHLWVYSEPGLGTTFKVYLPSSGATKIPAPEPRAVTSLVGTETILFVEDEPVLRPLIAGALRGYGYAVVEAENGSAALELADAQTEPFDLLVTDVVMPGINGRELAEQLLAKQPTLKLLFASGYPADTIVQHGVAQAHTNYIEKPYLPEDLARKIRVILDWQG